MNPKNAFYFSWNQVFIIPLLLTAIGCALIQNQLEKLSNQKTDTQSTPSLSSEETSIVPTRIETLSNATSSPELASTEILQLNEMQNLISGLNWTYSGGYTSLQVPLSGDLKTNEAMTLTAADIQTPAICLERSDCRNQVAIQISNQLPTLSCLQIDQVFSGEFCSMVSIPAGARFRLRGILYDTHPAQWNFIPILQILPASDVPCLEGEFRCEVDRTCFAGFDDYCRTCLGLEKERCTCQSPQGDLPDGTKCQYWVSGDVLQSGQCQAGVCE